MFYSFSNAWCYWQRRQVHVVDSAFGVIYNFVNTSRDVVVALNENSVAGLAGSICTTGAGTTSTAVIIPKLD